MSLFVSRRRSQSLEELQQQQQQQRRGSMHKTLSLDNAAALEEHPEEQQNHAASHEHEGRVSPAHSVVSSLPDSVLTVPTDYSGCGRTLRIAALSLGSKDVFREALEDQCRTFQVSLEWLTLAALKDGHTQPLNVFNTSDLLIVDHAEQPYDSFLTYKLSMRKNLEPSRWSVVIYKNIPRLRKDPPRYRSCESQFGGVYREKADGVMVELPTTQDAPKQVLPLRQFVGSVIRAKLDDMPASNTKDIRFKQRLDQAFDHKNSKEQRLRIISELEKMMQESPEFASTDRMLSVLYSYLEMEQWDRIVDLIQKRYQYTGITDIHPEIAYYYAFALNRRNRRVGKQSDRETALSIAERVCSKIKTKDAYGLVGRIYKDKFIESMEQSQLDPDFDSCEKAIEAYRRAFEIEESYGGVNLLTLLYVSNQFDAPERITERTKVAREMMHQFGKLKENADYWIAASRMETSLLEDQWTLANEACEEMQRLCTRSWMLKTTVRNVRLILDVRERREAQGLIKTAQDEATLKQQAIFNFWVDYFASSTKESMVLYPVIVEHSGINPVGGVRFRFVSIEPPTVVEGSCFQFQNAVGNDARTVTKYLFESVSVLQPEDKPHEAEEHIVDKRSVYMIASRGQQTDVLHVTFASEGCRTHFLRRAEELGYSMPHDDTPVGGVAFRWEYVRRNGARVEIGSGSTATVYEAMTLDSDSALPQTLAVKAVRADKMEGMSASEFSEMLNQEILTLRTLHCENLVQFFGWQQDNEEVLIIMEYVPGGSLTKMLDNYGGLARREHTMFYLACYAQQIVRAVCYLHERNMVHRDIKGDNVLVNQFSGTLKLTDMGTVKRLRGLRRQCRTSVFTPWFAAPEVYLEDSYGFPADIWSVGCTVWQLAMGEPPGVRKDERAIQDDRMKKVTPEIPEEWPEDLKHFLARCFVIDTKARATITDLDRDPLMFRAQVSEPDERHLRKTRSEGTDAFPQEGGFHKSASELTLPSLTPPHKPALMRHSQIEIPEDGLLERNLSTSPTPGRQLSASQLVFARSISSNHVETWDNASCHKTIVNRLEKALTADRARITEDWKKWGSESYPPDLDVIGIFSSCLDILIDIITSNDANRSEETMQEAIQETLSNMCMGEHDKLEAKAKAAAQLQQWLTQFSPKTGKKSRRDGSHWLLKIVRIHEEIEPHWMFVIATECDDAAKTLSTKIGSILQKKAAAVRSLGASMEYRDMQAGDRAASWRQSAQTSIDGMPTLRLDSGQNAARKVSAAPVLAGNHRMAGHSNQFATLLDFNQHLLETNQRLLGQMLQHEEKQRAAAQVDDDEASQTYDFIARQLGLSPSIADALLNQGMTYRILTTVPIDKDDLRDCGIPVGPRAVIMADIRRRREMEAHKPD